MRPKIAARDREPESDEAYRARIEREIDEGLSDVAAGRSVSAEEHKAEVEKLTAELRRSPGKKPARSA